MSRFAGLRGHGSWIAMLVAGCADNAMVLKGRLSQSEQQQTAMSRQYQQLQDRANALDRDNQEMGTLLGPGPATGEGVGGPIGGVARPTPRRHGATGPSPHRQGEHRQAGAGPDRLDAAARGRVDQPRTTAFCKPCRRSTLPASSSAATAT